LLYHSHDHGHSYGLRGLRTAPSFTPGNAGRNIVTGPGIIYSQGSPKKNFSIKERLNWPLRFDLQNPFHTASATRASRWISKTAVVWKDYRRSDDGFLRRPAAREFDGAAKLVNR
jgi:hypothetical protein